MKPAPCILCGSPAVSHVRGEPPTYCADCARLAVPAKTVIVPAFVVTKPKKEKP